MKSIENFKDWLTKYLPTVLIWVVGIGLLILVSYTILFGLSGYLSLTYKIDPEIGGYYGTFIGGLIGTIFTFATIILVWLTYETQKKELIETKNVLNLQQFESTFFSLLQIQRVIKKNILFDTSRRITSLSNDKSEPSIKISGDEFFEFAATDYRQLYIADENLSPRIYVNDTDEEFLRFLMFGDDIKHISKDAHVERIKLTYKKFFDRYHNYIGHYYRHTFHILNYIKTEREDRLQKIKDESDRIFLKEKFQFYADIVQAQMNSNELLLMFYNGICFPKANNIIEEFSFLENLAMEDLADHENHKNLYENFELKSRHTIVNQ